MGEAKRRGSKAERIALALDDSELTFDSITDEVDEDLFLYCSNIYTAAAQMTMTVENPSAKTIFRDGDKGYAFTDRPENRGFLAVNKELIEMGQEMKVRQPMICRLMHFGEVLKPNPLIDKWLKTSDRPDEVQVGESLIRACARAKFIHENDKLFFDMEDIARLSAEIEIRLDSIDEQKVQAQVA